MNKAEEMRNLVKLSIKRAVEDEYNRILGIIKVKASECEYAAACSCNYDENIEKLKKDGFRIKKNGDKEYFIYWNKN